MRIVTVVVVMFIGLISTADWTSSAAQVSTPRNADRSCAPLGSPHLRTTLYFGLSHKMGSITEAQWQSFLGQEVTPRFPDGLTVWEADGQWREANGNIGRERAKVLLLVHEDTRAVRSALGAIVESYKRRFQQESVLWETAPVCAAF